MFPSPSCARNETAARTGLRSHRGRSGYRVLASPLSFNVAVARRIASFACRAGAGCPVTAEVTTLVEDRRRRLLAFRWVASLLAVFWVSFSWAYRSVCLLARSHVPRGVTARNGLGPAVRFLVAVPLVVAAIRSRPGALVAGRQIGLVAVAVGLGALWSSSVSHLLMAGGLLLTMLLIVVILPARPRFTGRSWAWMPWALVIGAAVPWLGMHPLRRGRASRPRRSPWVWITGRYSPRLQSPSSSCPGSPLRCRADG